MKRTFWQALAVLAALLCSEITWAGDPVPTPAAAGNKADNLITSFDRLFKRTDLYHVETLPENSNVIRITPRITGHGFVTGTSWCGSRLLRFYYGFHDYDPGEKIPSEHGSYLADIQSRKVWRLNKMPGGGEVINCSPDGEWLLYSIREGKDAIVWRYQLHTGKKERFVRFRGGAIDHEKRWLKGEWSPDGNRILYFGKSMEAFKISDPVWQIFWFKRKFIPGNYAWLADSSGMVLRYRSDPHSPSLVVIDHSGDPAKPLEVLENAPSKFGALKMDNTGHLYGIEDTQLGPSRALTQLRRCTLQKMKILKCEPAIPGDPNISGAYDLSPDGKVVYYTGDEDDKGVSRRCLWRYEQSIDEKTCMVVQGFMDGLSPDGQYIAFSSGNTGGGFGVLSLKPGKER